jgi:heat shock protein HslJ
VDLKKYTVIIGAILSLVVLTTGCLPSSTDAVALDGTHWNVVELAGEPVDSEAEGTLDFYDDDVTGTAFCNGFGGSYDRDGSELTFGEQERTVMACIEPEGVMELESAYLEALARVAAYRVEESDLILLDEQGTELVKLTPATSVSLEGTSWQLTGLNTGLAMMSPVGDSEITATFEDGTVSGTAGCNQYNAAYALDTDALTIGPAASTRMACMAPEGVMEQEAAYLGALEDAATYTVLRDQLRLTDADGATLLSFVAETE